MKKPNLMITAISVSVVVSVAMTIVASNFIFNQGDSPTRVDAIAVSADDNVRSNGSGSSGNDAVSPSNGTGVVPSVAPVDVTIPEGGLGVVPGLSTASGTLEMRGDDFYLGRNELDLGPDEWAITTSATSDLNGNGKIESIWSEVYGLLGREVTVLGEIDDGDIDVYEINNVGIRPLYTSVAPWSKEWNANNMAGKPGQKLLNGITADDAARIALEIVPGVVVRAHVDIDDGRPYWELDIQGADGYRYEVEIDAITGVVVDVDKD